MHVRYQLTRVLLGLLFLALAPVQVATAGFKNGQWSTGHNIDWDAGNILPSPQWMPAGSPSTGNTTWGVSGGVASGISNGRLPVGKGYIDVQAKVIPDRPSLGGAFAKFARKGLPLLSTLYAVKELATDLGYVFNPDGTVSRSDPTICTVAPCVDYARFTGGTSSAPLWYSTISGACSASVGLPYSGRAILTADPFGDSGCTFTFSGASPVTWASATRNATPAPSNVVASTPEEFGDSVAAKTDWPSNSKLPAAIKEVADSGEPISASIPTVTGPSSVSEPATVTTNPDGTTVTRTVTHNVTYTGNTVNYTTTTVINNNGQVTTETKPAEPPIDQCQRYPDTVGCKNLDTPASDVLKTKTHAVAVTAVAFASSSVCPSPLSFTLRGASYGVSYQPLCDRLALLKALFLALAGVLAAFIVADSFRVQ